MPKGDFRAEKDQIYSLVGYDTNQGGKQVYVKPGTYVPGISATPWTPPTQTSTNQTALPEPTIKQSYGDFITPETAEEKAYRTEMERQQAIAQGLATETLDEATIRANTEKQFQSEIDALNRVYAEKKRQLAVEGQGRVGSTTSVQARRGLIGSDFGSAQTEQVKQYNQQIIDEAEAERAAAEANIRARARNAATTEYQSKLAAKQQGAEAYLEFLKGAAERKANTVKQTVANMLSEGVDLDSLDSDGLAKELGISVAELKRQYKEAKTTKETSDATAKLATRKTEAEISKMLQQDNSKVVGGNLLVKDASGNWKTVFTAEQKESLTPYQKFQATQAIAKDTQARTENAREMARQAELIKNSYNNILKGGDRSLNTQAIITSFNKILDPSSVVRESEYDRTAQGQSLINQLQGKYDNIVSGGAGVTEATLKEANDIAQRYLEGAKSSILKQNERAAQMAQQFGLNEAFVSSTYSEPTKTIDDYRSEFPEATDDELRALMEEEQGFNQVGNTSASTTSYLKNYGAVTGEGSPYWKWGLDVDLKKGDPVFSPVSGVIVQAGDNGDGFGNRVGIRTSKGNIVYLSHLDGVNARVGQTVSKNQLVGKGGNTGKTIATGGGDGSHLDITVKKPDGSYYAASEVRQRLS